MPWEGVISLCSFRVRGTLVRGTASAAHCRRDSRGGGPNWGWCVVGGVSGGWGGGGGGVSVG
jgi:hypothetical protein